MPAKPKVLPLAVSLSLPVLPLASQTALFCLCLGNAPQVSLPSLNMLGLPSMPPEVCSSRNRTAFHTIQLPSTGIGYLVAASCPRNDPPPPLFHRRLRRYASSSSSSLLSMSGSSIPFIAPELRR